MSTVRSSWRSKVATGLAPALIAAASVAVSAHRRDEYLQAARVAIEPDRVQIQLDLTAGIAVADAVLSQVDTDRTGTISSAETLAYGNVVMNAVSVEADGKPLHLALRNHYVPAIDLVRKGEGVIRLEISAEMPPLTGGTHSIRYRNTHRPEISVYLANALVPVSDRVAIAAQRRDVDQRELTVDFVLRPDPANGLRYPIMCAVVAGVMALAAGWYRQKTLASPPQ
jgi:hypothetical protein